MKTVKLSLESAPQTVLKVKYCDTFFSKFAGLMFTKALAPDRGIIIVENSPSRLNTAIHMTFMRYDLTVLWLDPNLVIVDKILAKRWAPFYMSKHPAQYVVECHRDRFPEFSVGERFVMADTETELL